MRRVVASSRFVAPKVFARWGSASAYARRSLVPDGRWLERVTADINRYHGVRVDNGQHDVIDVVRE